MSRMPPLTEEKVLVPTELLCNLLLEIQDAAHRSYYSGTPLLSYEDDMETLLAINYLEEVGELEGDYFELKAIVEKLDDNSNY